MTQRDKTEVWIAESLLLIVVRVHMMPLLHHTAGRMSVKELMQQVSASD